MNLKIFALGGLNEVGKNCYVFEKNEDIIIVDCGVKFLRGNNLVDGAIPNFSYLWEKRQKIKGLFVTHGHEDHIGAIPYLLKLIPTITVFCSSFSASHLKQRLQEDLKKRVTTFREYTVIDTSEFQIRFFRVTHSIPGSFGLIIEASQENKEKEKKLFRFMKGSNINKIILNQGSKSVVKKEKIQWWLTVEYSGARKKILTSLRSETFFSNLLNLKVVDVKNYLQEANKNSITRQELNNLLFNIRIVVTGDFKFDWTEIGERFDLAKLAKFGDKGVDLLLSDSTNAEIEGTTPSESKVIRRLEKIIVEAKGRVIVTSFSTNVYRLKKVTEIAKRAEKKIVLLGSSLERMTKSIEKAINDAKSLRDKKSENETDETSLWEMDKSIFLEAEKVAETPNNKLIIFCTGSQGEEKAVLSRLAHQSYLGWKIEAGDSVILTSSPIMDNKSQVEMINNKLFALGAKIYENSKEDLLHASGHACQEDLKLMLRLTKPRYFMPFHGNFRMLVKHGELAKEVGIAAQNIFVCQNGEVLETKEKDFFLSKKKVFSQPNYIFNKRLVSTERLNNDLALRKEMFQGGLILVIIFYDEKKQTNNSVSFFTYGFIDMKKNSNLIAEWKKNLSEFVIKNIDNKLKKENLEKRIQDYVKEYLLKGWQKEKPYVCSLLI